MQPQASALARRPHGGRRDLLLSSYEFAAGARAIATAENQRPTPASTDASSVAEALAASDRSVDERDPVGCASASRRPLPVGESTSELRDPDGI